MAIPAVPRTGETRLTPTADRDVVDERGDVWTLTGEPLGKGGYGSVFRVRGHPAVVKVMERDQPEHRLQLERDVKAIRRLPLRDLSIALPGPLLQPPDVGYVMQLADGMTTLETLVWYMPHNRPEPLDWFRTTGGACRRLLILATLAEELAALHARGIVYCDLSAGNVMISGGTGDSEVWLIDPDNLRYAEATRPVPWTAQWAAPECVRRGRNYATSLSEAHALAALAFTVLTVAHPLLDGAAVHRAAAGSGLYDLALEGRLPWIDHAGDDMNRRMAGFGSHVAMTAELQSLTRAAFEEGLTDVTRRPSARQWADALRAATTQCVRCPDCTLSYVMHTPVCPSCGAARPRAAVLTIGPVPAAEDGEEPRPVIKTPRSRRVVVQDGTGQVALTADLLGLRSASPRDEIGFAQLERDRLHLRLDVEDAWLARDGVTPERIGGDGVVIAVGSSGAPDDVLHTGGADEIHRGASIAILDEAAAR